MLDKYREVKLKIEISERYLTVASGPSEFQHGKYARDEEKNQYFSPRYRQAPIYILVKVYLSGKLGQCNGFPSFRHNTRIYSNRSHSRFRSSAPTHREF